LTGDLIIPDGVTSIGYGAFSNCSGLTGDLIIPDGVTSIGDFTFFCCSGLTSITIPDGVTSIGEYAFAHCWGVTGDLIIPAGVTFIDRYAFGDCPEVASVTINSKTMVSYSADMLTNSRKLTAIYVPAELVNSYKDAYGWSNFADKIQAITSLYEISQDQWVVSGHCAQIVGKEGHAYSPMVAAGGVESAALLHQGAIYVGELDLSKFSKVIIYNGTDAGPITQNHYNDNANNRFILSKVDTEWTMSPAEKDIIASATYTLHGWAVEPFVIDLTDIDYNGPVYVTWDTLPGTFMVVSEIVFVYE
jgi:hypothetical protein